MDNSAAALGSAMVPICQLKPGQKGTVVRLDGESGLRQHLLEMGFTKGTEVEFVRQAPLGDPVDLRLRGYRLSLRRNEASVVIVRPLPTETITRDEGNTVFGPSSLSRTAHQGANR
ncbi:MAG: ferrous iron transport protein A [Capsulimonadaceae bacterium]|nr:ferrous iron transport protein A [Capsulimonadaceae bacterium]